MTLQFVFFVLCGALIGGFINGLAGTATALFALGFFLAVLDPIKAVAVIALISVLSGVQGLWVVRKELFKRPRRLLTFLSSRASFSTVAPDKAALKAMGHGSSVPA